LIKSAKETFIEPTENITLSTQDTTYLSIASTNSTEIPHTTTSSFESNINNNNNNNQGQ
jgi:hypothetical protein